MDLFFILVALALLLLGCYQLSQRAWAIAVVAIVFAVVVFLLRDTLTSESEDIGAPVAVTVVT